MELIELVGSVLNVPVKTLTQQSGPENTVEWDSLAHIGIIAAAEQTYKVQLTMPEILSVKTIADLGVILKNHNVKFSNH
jgi:acyl carrier protein